MHDEQSILDVKEKIAEPTFNLQEYCHNINLVELFKEHSHSSQQRKKLAAKDASKSEMPSEMRKYQLNFVSLVAMDHKFKDGIKEELKHAVDMGIKMVAISTDNEDTVKS